MFQFVRVEDIAYDPDNPRVVYFADTGNTRLVEDSGTGRLYRAASGGTGTSGRIFKMVLNATDPTVVDSFSILVDASAIGMRNPDNVAVSHNSVLVQEDTSNAKVWMYPFATGTWTHVATANQPSAETSGIVDVSTWFGDGWWALDVQSHTNQTATTGRVRLDRTARTRHRVHVSEAARERTAAAHADPRQLSRTEDPGGAGDARTTARERPYGRSLASRRRQRSRSVGSVELGP